MPEWCGRAIQISRQVVVHSDDLRTTLARNLIYNFHFYEPHLFTYQGATWGLEYWHHLREIPYPATPENIRAAAEAQPTEPARLHLLRYGLEHWGSEGIDGEMAAAAAWANRHHVPLTCNEFGVYRAYAVNQ